MYINSVSQFIQSIRTGVNERQEQDNQNLAPGKHGQETAAAHHALNSDRFSLKHMRPESARQYLTESVVSNLFRSQGIPPAIIPQVNSHDEAVDQIAAATQAVTQPSADDNGTIETPTLAAASEQATAEAQRVADTLDEANASPDVISEIRDLLGDIKTRLDNLIYGEGRHDEDDRSVAPSRFDAGYQAVNSSNNTSIEIETADGDIVKINVANAMSEETTQFSYGGVQGMEHMMSRERTLEFSVEGELDEDELKAINKVMHNLNGIADRFYNGNVDHALENALDLGVGMDEIAAVSMDMSYSYQAQAVNLYQQVAGEPMTDQTGNKAQSMVQEIATMAQEMAETYSFSKQHAPLADPRNALSVMLQGILDVHPQNKEIEAHDDDSASPLMSLFKEVTEED